jgi:hypothetical protein
MEGTDQVAASASASASASARSRKARVRLTAEQRAHLEGIVRDGATKRKRFVHARALLMADEAHAQGRYTDAQVGGALGVAAKTVARIRSAFLRGGITVAVERKPRATPPVEPVIDGRAEATLVAICCSPAPGGRARWTMQLLADELVARKVVVSVCKETVRKTLKKTSCSPGA